jgi:hypothetical protein
MMMSSQISPIGYVALRPDAKSKRGRSVFDVAQTLFAPYVFIGSDGFPPSKSY